MILHTVCTLINNHTLNMMYLYLGPGMDGGAISMIIAFLVSSVTFLVSLIWYPVKKIKSFFKNIFNKTTSSAPQKDSPDNK